MLQNKVSDSFSVLSLGEVRSSAISTKNRISVFHDAQHWRTWTCRFMLSQICDSGEDASMMRSVTVKRLVHEPKITAISRSFLKNGGFEIPACFFHHFKRRVRICGWFRKDGSIQHPRTFLIVSNDVTLVRRFAWFRGLDLKLTPSAKRIQGQTVSAKLPPSPQGPNFLMHTTSWKGFSWFLRKWFICFQFGDDDEKTKGHLGEEPATQTLWERCSSEPFSLVVSASGAMNIPSRNPMESARTNLMHVSRNSLAAAFSGESQPLSRGWNFGTI